MFILLEIRRKLIKILTLGSPIIAIVLVYFFDVQPLNLLKDILNERFFQSIDKSTTILLVNQAIITFVISLCTELYKHFGVFSINVQNKDRKNTTYLPLGQDAKSKKLDIDLVVDYRNVFIKWLIEKNGGLGLVVNIPYWLSLEVRNKGNFKPGSVDDSNYEFTTFSLSKIIQEKSIKSNVYISVELLSSATTFAEGQIILEIRPNSNKRLCRFACYIFIFLFFDIKESNHEIISTR